MTVFDLAMLASGAGVGLVAAAFLWALEKVACHWPLRAGLHVSFMVGVCFGSFLLWAFPA